MREIKFRVWDKKEKRFCLPFLDPDLTVYKATELRVLITGHERYEFNLYTGLKDKNGREIYEGDIVKIGKRRKGVIIYSDEKACFVVLIPRWDFKAGFYNEYDLAKNSTLLEVIGNIYENPELIKNHKETFPCEGFSSSGEAEKQKIKSPKWNI